MSQITKRYKTDIFIGKSLENNPLKSPVNRRLHIYLPPGYYEDKERRYPVIYFLHGYASNEKSWTITSKDSPDKAVDWNQVPKKLLNKISLDRLLTFEALDELIIEGDLPPFILVQPNGSLEIPNKHKRKDLRGNIMTKGSFYLNSRYSGNYMDYIIQDVITYIDSNYKTISNKKNRILMGGSMGGYGVLYLSIHHPEKFIASIALSPGNFQDLDAISWKLKVPIYTEIFGDKISTEIGDFAWEDIMDTYDLIFSNNNRLIPSIKRNEKGQIVDYDKDAFQNWQKYNIINLIDKKPDSLRELHLQINCHKNDEFGLTVVAEEVHKKLLELDIAHDYDIYSDPDALLTPHMLGIGYHILPGIKFGLQFMD